MSSFVRSPDMNDICTLVIRLLSHGQCGGLVGESLTPEQEVRISIPNSAVLCS